MEAITIVGAGVAGLTLAAALDPHRFEIRLIEQRTDLPGVGTGFGIWPFAMAALETLGPPSRTLADEVSKRAVPIRHGRIVIGDRTRRVESQTLLLITRPDLLTILAAAVAPSVIREQRRVGEVASEPGDLVVAADGVNSLVRRVIWGDAPRNTGAVAMRGILQRPCDLDGMGEYWLERMLFGLSVNAQDTTNWYACAADMPVDPATALAWARDRFNRFPEPVRTVLTAARPEHTVVNPVIEARTTTRLVRGRYVLIGDAAHAMSPNLGRGACESMVDAAVLARAMNRFGAAAGARRYERSRLVFPQLVKHSAAGVRRLSLAGGRSHRLVAAAVRAA